MHETSVVVAISLEELLGSTAGIKVEEEEWCW